ncbi:MAG: glycosyltransferase [Dehalococcoidales bacterium]|nr:glycosyltransferase [Dehalococcoidales bacterium]
MEKNLSNNDYLVKPGICLITCPMGEFGFNPPVIMSAIKIFYPLVKRLFIISSNLKYEASPDPKISVINVHHDLKKEGMIIRVFKQIFWQIKLSRRLFKIRENTDIVIFYLGSITYLLPAMLAKIAGKSVVLHLSGSASDSARAIYAHTLYGFGGKLFHFILGMLESINYHIADLIVAESKSQVVYFKMDKYLKKIRYVNFVFNTDLFIPNKSIENRRFTVGFIGRLGEEKGIMNFIKALPAVLGKFPDLKVFIGGDGDLKPAVLNEIAASGLGDNVTFSGWIPHEQLVKSYNDIKILVIPSYTESGPIVLLEAMACGTVVLATRVGIVPDVIRNGVNGFLLEDNSPVHIAQKLIEIIDYPNLKQISQSACETVKSGFSHEAATATYRDIFASLTELFSPEKIKYRVKSV